MDFFKTKSKVYLSFNEDELLSDGEELKNKLLSVQGSINQVKHFIITLRDVSDLSIGSVVRLYNYTKILAKQDVRCDIRANEKLCCLLQDFSFNHCFLEPKN